MQKTNSGWCGANYSGARQNRAEESRVCGEDARSVEDLTTQKRRSELQRRIAGHSARGDGWCWAAEAIVLMPAKNTNMEAKNTNGLEPRRHSREDAGWFTVAA